MMADENAPEAALERLDTVLTRLENVLAENLDSMRDQSDLEDEIQRLDNDRSQLADALDKEKARAGRILEVNQEVSRRMVTAMESIRGIIERNSN